MLCSAVVTTPTHLRHSNSALSTGHPTLEQIRTPCLQETTPPSHKPVGQDSEGLVQRGQLEFPSEVPWEGLLSEGEDGAQQLGHCTADTVARAVQRAQAAVGEAAELSRVEEGGVLC